MWDWRAFRGRARATSSTRVERRLPPTALPGDGRADSRDRSCCERGDGGRRGRSATLVEFLGRATASGSLRKAAKRAWSSATTFVAQVPDLNDFVAGVKIHSRMRELLGEAGAWIDRIFHPLHERGTCACHKGDLCLPQARHAPRASPGAVRPFNPRGLGDDWRPALMCSPVAPRVHGQFS